MRVTLRKKFSSGKFRIVPDQALEVVTEVLKLLAGRANEQLIAVHCHFKGNPWDCVAVIKLVMRSNRPGLPNKFVIAYEERFQIGNRCLGVSEMQNAVSSLLEWAVREGYSY